MSNWALSILEKTLDIIKKYCTAVIFFRVQLDMLSVQGNSGPPWAEKESKAFWRGRDARLERLHLIDLARQHPHLFNASLTNFFFFRDKESEYGPKQPHVSFYSFFEVGEDKLNTKAQNKVPKYFDRP